MHGVDASEVFEYNGDYEHSQIEVLHVKTEVVNLSDSPPLKGNLSGLTDRYPTEL